MKLSFTIVSALMLAVCSLGHAQQVKYGLKAGVNIANYDARVSIVDLNTKSIPSFYVTAFADIPLVRNNFSIQPGLSFQGKGGGLNGSFPNPMSSQANSTIAAKYEEKPYWLEIPINFIGRTDIGGGNQFFVGAGPYVAFGVGGEYKIKTSGASFVDLLGVSGDLDFGDGGELKSTDVGLTFLTGFELKSGFGINVGYALGLTDVGGTKLYVPFNQKNRVLSFGLSKTF